VDVAALLDWTVVSTPPVCPLPRRQRARNSFSLCFPLRVAFPKTTRRPGLTKDSIFSNNTENSIEGS